MHDNITIKEDQIFIGLKDGGTEWFAFSTAAQLNDVETTFDRVNAFIGQHALPATTEDYDYEARKTESNNKLETTHHNDEDTALLQEHRMHKAGEVSRMQGALRTVRVGG